MTTVAGVVAQVQGASTATHALARRLLEEVARKDQAELVEFVQKLLIAVNEMNACALRRNERVKLTLENSVKYSKANSEIRLSSPERLNFINTHKDFIFFGDLGNKISSDKNFFKALDILQESKLVDIYYDLYGDFGNMVALTEEGKAFVADLKAEQSKP